MRAGGQLGGRSAENPQGSGQVGGSSQQRAWSGAGRATHTFTSEFTPHFGCKPETRPYVWAVSQALHVQHFPSRHPGQWTVGTQTFRLWHVGLLARSQEPCSRVPTRCQVGLRPCLSTSEQPRWETTLNFL